MYSHDISSREAYIESQFSETWLQEGIVFIRYKPVVLEIDLSVAKIIVRDRLRVTNGIKRPCFVDLNKVHHGTKEARTYFAKSKSEGNKELLAGALLVYTKAAYLGANFFSMIDEPAIPTKVFLKEEKAIEWLKTFIK